MAVGGLGRLSVKGANVVVEDAFGVVGEVEETAPVLEADRKLCHGDDATHRVDQLVRRPSMIITCCPQGRGMCFP
jgi:hypothetical protein